MLSEADNERLTRTGPGTPMGALMRRYWIPALLSEELPAPDCAPVRVRLLGENLVAFRDSDGRAGLMDERCPHRGASLFFGRSEEGGLRCIYHGWKFDVAGRCLDMPNEPPERQFKDRLRARAFPVREAAGVIWAYMGAAEKQPPFTDQEWMRLPPGHSYVTKNLAECNWLQLLEGGFDESHSSFLHRRMSWSRNEDGTKTQFYRAQSHAPRHDVVITEFGYSYASIRELPEGRNYVRVVQFVMPFHQMRSFEGIQDCPLVSGHIWTPIDDEHCWVWSWMYAKDGRALARAVIEAEERGAGRSPEFFIPGTYRFRENKANDYLIDRGLQRTSNFTGIDGIAAQDQAAQESMGPIADRTIEHLGTADIAVITTRRLLLKACRDIEEGRDPLGSQLESIKVRAAEKTMTADRPWLEELSSDLVAVA